MTSITLALATSCLGLLISPKLVSFHFIDTNLNEHQLQSGGKLYEAEVDIKTIHSDQSVTKQVAAVRHSILKASPSFLE